ncbi:MAG TPA: hypothetical protein VF723_09835 [Pyrinomonadaceae bacterium]|jgi:hypothetical protein
MRNQLLRRITVVLALFLAVGISLDDASAQRRRNKRSRRSTNPVITSAPDAGARTPAIPRDPQIISTADEEIAGQTPEPANSDQPSGNTRRSNRSRAQAEDPDTMRRTINKLSAQVTSLSEKLGQMENQQRTLVDLERLSRAEQRAEALRTQLRDVQAKESDLQARAEQIEIELQPDNIERSVATFGTTRPEDARAARRRTLESEKTRVRAQLDLMATSRTRLESAIAGAEAEADRLRQRLDDTNNSQPNSETNTNTEGNSTTQPGQAPAPTQNSSSTNPPL